MICREQIVLLLITNSKRHGRIERMQLQIKPKYIRNFGNLNWSKLQIWKEEDNCKYSLEPSLIFQSLLELLKLEEEQFRLELENTRETSEMRQEAMLQRARQLKSAREEERKAFAEAQKYKRWK
jgi:hypothetical protein